MTTEGPNTRSTPGATPGTARTDAAPAGKRTPKARTADSQRGTATANARDRAREPAALPAADAALRERIAIRAFLRAEARGFAPGFELEDWLTAEREVDTEQRKEE